MRLQTIIGLALTLTVARAGAQTNPVQCWGSNGYGQLGDNTITMRKSPVPAFYLSGIKQISAGGTHTLALTSDGDVYGWGDNTVGQLGLGDAVSRDTPTHIPLAQRVIAISAGLFHSLALRDDGLVYSWGYNNRGQLGLGDNTTRLTPTLTSLSRVKSIAAGGYHSVVLAANGIIHTVGDNSRGQLVNGTTVSSSSWLYTGQIAKAIGAGRLHTVRLTDGRVSCGGDNVYGQLGISSTTTSFSTTFKNTPLAHVRAIATGPAADHTLAIGVNGGVVGWGRNTNGQLGDGTKTNRFAPVGMRYIANVKAASCGFGHSLLLPANGTVWAVGANDQGQLGDGTLMERTRPVKVLNSLMVTHVGAGSSHSAMLRCYDGARAWGFNGYGQLGVGSIATKLTPTQMSGLASGFVDVAAGTYHTLALRADGIVYACGENSFGQLGLGHDLGQTKAVPIPGLTNVIDIAAGGYYSMAITADGMLWAWGSNFSGELGTGDYTTRYQPTPVDWGHIEAQCAHSNTILLAVDGTLWLCGRDLLTAETHPTIHPFPPVVPTYSAVATGHRWITALTPTGTLTVLGENDFGQLSQGDRFPVTDPSGISVNAKAVAAGALHSLHLNGIGEVWGAGYNAYGQLGDGTGNDRLNFIRIIGGAAGFSSAGYHAAAFDSAGRLFAWGYNGDGQIGDGTTQNRFVPTYIGSHPYTTDLARGSSAYHSVALSSRPIMLSSVKLSTTTVKGGTSLTGTITLTAAAGAGGLTVELLSLNTAVVTVPASVFIPAGSKTANFSITTKAVTTQQKVTIQTHLHNYISPVLTVNP